MSQRLNMHCNAMLQLYLRINWQNHRHQNVDIDDFLTAQFEF